MEPPRMGGSRRIAISSGEALTPQNWRWEATNLPGGWPYLGPTWLLGTEKALIDARPWHTLARRGAGESAWLPGFVFERPAAPAWDPRTYLGWRPAACIGDPAGAGGAISAGMNSDGPDNADLD